MNESERRDNRMISRRVLDALFILQVSLTVIVLAIIVVYTVTTAQEVAQISQRQIDFVTEQNNQQLCNQHDALTALVKIGDRLGIPTKDIEVPSVGGLNCS